MLSELSLIFKRSFRDLIKNPIVIIPSVLIFITSLILSNISVNINNKIANSSSFIITSWLVIFTLIFFLIFSYFYSGLISLSFSSIKRKAKISDFFVTNRFFAKNFVILLILLVFYDLIRIIIQYLAYNIGKLFNLSSGAATFLFFLLYFVILIGPIIFLTFSSFFLVRDNLSIIGSIRKSISFTYNNYISAILIILIFFVIFQLVSYISDIISFNIISISEIISYLLLYPLLALVLTRLIEK